MQLKTYRSEFIVSHNVIQYNDTVFTVLEDTYSPKLYTAKAYDNTGQVYMFRTDFFRLTKHIVRYNKKSRRWEYIPIVQDAIIKR